MNGSAMRMSASNGWIKRLEVSGATEGPLSGLRFGVKDMYAVKGRTSSCGNPTWLKTHEPALRNAECVQSLLDAGATLIGTTHMDELAYSLNGENVHYGTPVNAAAPERVPGGSSSGSASVVAAGEADFSIGSDTAGSVRIPASYQGLFGFRPTHNRIRMEGAIPLAPSFDTCGWFARDARMLQTVGGTLMPGRAHSIAVKDQLRLLVASDAFAQSSQASEAMYKVLSKVVPSMKSRFGVPKEVCIVEGDETLLDWLTAFRTIQAFEVWRAHGDWVQKNQPHLGPGVQERFTMASQVNLVDVEAARLVQSRARERLASLLSAYSPSFVLIPTAPGPAPFKGTPAPELELYRTKALALTSVAGLCGLPQVSIPCGKVDGAPVGLGVIGQIHADQEVLQVAVEISDMLHTMD